MFIGRGGIKTPRAGDRRDWDRKGGKIIRSGSFTFVAAIATGIGVLAALIFLGQKLPDGSDGAPSSHVFLALIPLLSCIFTGMLVYKLCVLPLKSEFEKALYLAKNALARNAETTTQTQIADSLTGAIQQLSDHVINTRQREKSLVDNAVDVICVIDIDAKILQVNPASLSVWGYSPQEIAGKNLSDFLEKDDIDKTFQSVLGAEKSIEKIFFENRFRKKSGEIIDLLWSAHWSASDGGLFCVAHDITKRKRAERLLKESEERIREIFENLPAGVVVLNRSGFVQFINSTGCKLSGHSTEHAIGLSASELFVFCENVFSPKQLDIRIDEGNAEFESIIIKGDGQRFHADISISRLKLDGEKCYLVSFLDNSIKHAIEMAKREFVMMVSHDLRSPLTSILSILSYLEDGHGGTLNATGQSLAVRARKESERLIQLIHDLLDLEKMKAGKFNMHFSSFNLKELIAAAIEAVSRYAELHNVRISEDVAPDIICFCDGARVIQVLVNLLDNAIKFTPQGEVVRIDVLREESNPELDLIDKSVDLKKMNKIQIRISNKGRLIPKEKLTAIFDRFEQVDDADSKERKGTGLGLAICKTIVEQHFGKMWATSGAEKGTRFIFTLPVEDKRKLAEMQSDTVLP